MSSFSRSPAETSVVRPRLHDQQQQPGTNLASTNFNPSNSHRTGTNHASTNQNVSSSQMTPKYYRSPNSALTPLQNSNYLDLNNRTSPRKQQPQSEVKVSAVGHGFHGDNTTQSYSRQRAPAFGQSDIWTEL